MKHIPLITAMAVLSLGLVACTSPEEEAAQEIEKVEEALDEAGLGGNGELEPVYLDLDPEGTNTADLADGLSIAFADFERGVSSYEDTPFVGFDVTITNDTGDVFNPESVNFWYTVGAEGTDAQPVLDADQGVGTIEEQSDEYSSQYSGEYAAFGATISDGEKVTIRFGYAMPEDEERLEIRLQPWDVEGAADVYLTGDIPAA